MKYLVISMLIAVMVFGVTSLKPNTQVLSLSPTILFLNNG